jgi:hypothetical protein
METTALIEERRYLCYWRGSQSEAIFAAEDFQKMPKSGQEIIIEGVCRCRVQNSAKEGDLLRVKVDVYC